MSKVAKSNNLSGRKSDKKATHGNKGILDHTDSVISGHQQVEKVVQGYASPLNDYLAL
jgi:hypothetical protein